MENREIRVIKKPVELRAAKADDGSITFSGYVFEWNTLSDDLGGFFETIRKGAASKWLANPPHNLFAVLDHAKEVRNVLGDLDTKTLRLFEDDRGLGFAIDAGPTTGAQDAAIVVGRNRVGMSFAFVKGLDAWTANADGTRLRTISEFADLEDISIVVDAAYKSSDVTVAKRSLEEAIEVERRAAQQTEADRKASEKRVAEQKAAEQKAAAAAKQASETRAANTTQPNPSKKETGMSIEMLQRELELKELEFRCYGDCYPSVASSSGPTHGDLAGDANRFTRRAMETKRDSGAPSRALELKAAAAHDMAADAAKAENLPAAEKFHRAAAEMHRAASGDDYAADFDASGTAYRSAAKDPAVERRAAGGHDEDGKFHDGSAKAILSAAAGRMAKAEAGHEAAVEKHTKALEGSNAGLTAKAAEKRTAAAQAHSDAVQAAEEAITAADSAHAAMVTEHRAACTESRAKMGELQVIGNDVPLAAAASSAVVE